MDKRNLSDERLNRNKGEVLARIEEVKRMRRFMVNETQMDFALGFFKYMEVRHKYLDERLKDLEREGKEFNEI